MIDLEGTLPKGWEIIDECEVICPCGNSLEWDAPTCPDGCHNPMIGLGFI